MLTVPLSWWHCVIRIEFLCIDVASLPSNSQYLIPYQLLRSLLGFIFYYYDTLMQNSAVYSLIKMFAFTREHLTVTCRISLVKQ